MERAHEINIRSCLMALEKTQEHRPRFGWVGHYLGIWIILSLVPAVALMYFSLLFLNRFYFWFHKQPPIDSKPYFKFDRHKIDHLSFLDKISCEYCEWANGTLQWGLAIANEVERKFCPIRNNCNACCEKVKDWRRDFLEYHHSPAEMEDYYENHYSKKEVEENAETSVWGRPYLSGHGGKATNTEGKRKSA